MIAWYKSLTSAAVMTKNKKLTDVTFFVLVKNFFTQILQLTMLLAFHVSAYLLQISYSVYFKLHNAAVFHKTGFLWSPVSYAKRFKSYLLHLS